MQMIGETLFEDLAPTPLVQGPPLPPESNMDLIAADDLHAVGRGSEVPPTLRHVLGTSLDALPWVPVAPGIHQHIIDLSSGAAGDLRLLRLAAGTIIPEHGHHGEELSLILRGSCRDEFGAYSVGDFVDLDDEARHTMQADTVVGCIIIIGSETMPEFAHGWE